MTAGAWEGLCRAKCEQVFRAWQAERAKALGLPQYEQPELMDALGLAMAALVEAPPGEQRKEIERLLIPDDPARVIGPMLARMTDADKQAFNFCVISARNSWKAKHDEAQQRITALEAALREALGRFLYAPVSVCRDCLNGERACECIPTCLQRSDNHAAGIGILESALAAPTSREER